MEKFALFDFDKTITREDSILTLLKYTFKKYPFQALFLSLRILLALIHSFFARDYVYLKNAVLKCYVLLKPEERDYFLKEIMPKMYYSDALKEIKKRKEEGYTLYLVSASIEPYLIPLGKSLGFDYVFGTKFQDGKIMGLNHRSEEKVRRLKDFFLEKNISFQREQSVAYSDSYLADRPMLELAEEKFLINSSFEVEGYHNLTWN